MHPSDDRSPAWRRYLRFWGTDVRRDIEDEIAFHVDGLTAEYVRNGMEAGEARRAAEARFGDAEQVERAMRELAQQRETTMRRTEWIDAVRRDLRFALRQLGRRPAFTAVAVATLALGIGANTAIFSAVDAVLLHPLPTPGLDRIAVVRTNLPTMNLMNIQLGPGEAIDVMNRHDLFDAVGSWAARSAVLVGQGDPRRLPTTLTMGHFFETFGVVPSLGRLYRPDESELDRFHVVVLGHGLWQELGADRAIIGKSIMLGSTSYEVVGVAPADFDYPRGTQLYMPAPITAKTAQNRGQLIWNVVGRIKAGVSMQQFEAGILAEQRRWHQNPEWGYEKLNQFLTVIPLGNLLAGQLRPVLLVLLGAVGFVLLIACANVASLQLVHATARSKELAVRSALGASRGTIVRQLLVENLALSLGGGLVGVGVGAAMLALLARMGGTDMPALQHVRLDRAALAFAAVVTILAGLLSGILPAVRGGGVDLNETLKETTRGGTLGARRNGLLQASVVVQVALALVLLLGSGLMIRSLARLLSESVGFNPEHVVTFRATTSGARYAQGPAILQFYDGLLDRLRHVPGISSVGMVTDLPFGDPGDSSPFRIIGRDPDPSGPEMHANLHAASEDYFTAMAIPVLRGRAFTAADIKGAPNVAIIDARLAKLFFPNEDPVGKRINQGMDATIVGVVGTVNQAEVGEPAKATVYYPDHQHDWYATYYVAVRTTLPTATLMASVRNAVTGIDANVPVFDIRTLEERISVSLAPRRLAMGVLTTLAALSLLLSVLGLYGVISYAVSQRTTEFGIRAALGAQPSQVRGLVVRQGLRLAAIGVVLGIAGASLATRALASLLFGITPHDPLTFVVAALLVTVVAAAASYAPARRATKVDLVNALRGG